MREGESRDRHEENAPEGVTDPDDVAQTAGRAVIPPERDPNSPTSTHVHEEGIDMDHPEPANRIGTERI